MYVVVHIKSYRNLAYLALLIKLLLDVVGLG